MEFHFLPLILTFSACLSVALAVLLDFLLQVTAFVALITFDCRRAEDNRIDCFPCIKVPSSTGGSNEGIYWSIHFSLGPVLA